MLKSRGWIAVAVVLAVAGCGSPTPPAPFKAPPTTQEPATDETPVATATLRGQVYAAENTSIDDATGLPVGYQRLPDGGTVTVRAIGLASGETTVAIVNGAYEVPNLPLKTRLEVSVSRPGLGSRAKQAVIQHEDGLVLNFEHKEKGDGDYLIDQPTLVEVSPDPGRRIDPSKPTAYTLRFSEPLDSASVDPTLITLSSDAIPGLLIGHGTALFARDAHVSQPSPDSVTLNTNAPLANIIGRSYPLVRLSFGAGGFRERADGNVLSAVGPQPVAGNLGPDTIEFRFWTDDRVPELLNGSLSGGLLRLQWSEAMATMLNSENASGSFDPDIVRSSGYAFATASAEAGPFESAVATLSLRFDPADTALLTGTLEGIGRGTYVQIRPTRVSDPAGNPATGSVVLRVP